jgi:hypothetical protein
LTVRRRRVVDDRNTPVSSQRRSAAAAIAENGTMKALSSVGSPAGRRRRAPKSSKPRNARNEEPEVVARQHEERQRDGQGPRPAPLVEQEGGGHG